MAQSIALGNSVIHQIDGFYSLKDLHIASGSAEKHKPSNFMRLEQTQALIHELAKGSDMSLFVKVIKGCKGGTYACRELVIAYAAWISASFHLKVIRVFMGNAQKHPTPTSRHWHVVLTADGVAQAIRHGELSVGEVSVIAEAAVSVLFRQSIRDKIKHPSEAEKIKDNLKNFTLTEQYEIAALAYSNVHGALFDKINQIGGAV